MSANDQIKAYYESSFFSVMRLPGDSFCKHCLGRNSVHMRPELDDNPNMPGECPIKVEPPTSFEHGGEFIVWDVDSDSHILTDDAVTVRDMVIRYKARKLLKATGERMVLVTPNTPHLILTYEERETVLKLLNAAAEMVAKNKDPSLFEGLTPDEIGNLTSQLFR